MNPYIILFNSYYCNICGYASDPRQLLPVGSVQNTMGKILKALISGVERDDFLLFRLPQLFSKLNGTPYFVKGFK